MPPVVPVGSLSTMVAFHASLLPVFCTLRVNCPSWPGFIVAGPPLVITRPSAAALPGGAATHVAERHPSRIKVVSDRDLVDFDVRPVGIDHRAGRRTDQLWAGARVGKGYPDRDEGRPRRVLFVDLADRYEEVRARQDVRAGDRVSHEPDEIPVRLVAGEVAGEIDVVEDDQPAPSGAGETDVGGQWVGRWEVPD